MRDLRDYLIKSKDGTAINPGNPAIANPIYRETITRILSQGMQAAIPAPEFKWQKPDKSLDMDALLKEFQRFWRRHSEVRETKADYTEAFLQRVVNGGGLFLQLFSLIPYTRVIFDTQPGSLRDVDESSLPNVELRRIPVFMSDFGGRILKKRTGITDDSGKGNQGGQFGVVLRAVRSD